MVSGSSVCKSSLFVALCYFVLVCVYVCVVIWVGRDGYVGFEAGLVMLFLGC